MKEHLVISLRLTAVLLVITCGLYPALIWAIGQTAFRDRANGSLLLEVPNRGWPHFISLVDGGDADLAHDAGDAWLLRKGFTIVSVGWQWDAAGQDSLKLYAPIAKEGGRRITGLLRGDVMLSRVAEEIPLGHLILGNLGGVEYPVVAPSDPRNVLTVRDSRDGKRTAIPRSEWQFARTVNGKLVPSDRHIHLNAGFLPGKIYEYVYVVADPVIAGGGFAGVAARRPLPSTKLRLAFDL